LRVTGKLEQVGGRVERKAPKTRRSRRTVPFSDAIAAVLKAQRGHVAERKLALQKEKHVWKDDDGKVFPSRDVSLSKTEELLPAGRWWTPNAFAQAWRRAMDAANGRLLGEFVASGGEVEDFTPITVGIHALRHTYATMQLRAGVRDEIVSRRLGHSSSIVTRSVYSHVTAEERREGVDVTDDALGSTS
jgi:integrase